MTNVESEPDWQFPHSCFVISLIALARDNLFAFVNSCQTRLN